MLEVRESLQREEDFLAQSLRWVGVATVVLVLGRERAPPPGQREERPCLVLRVRDEGVGIPPDELEKVFEPFFTTKEVGEGTGHGLAVTHGIVGDHGGWITAESAPGAGSTFVIHLPCEEVHR